MRRNQTFLSSKYRSMLISGTITSFLAAVEVTEDVLIAGAMLGKDAAAGVNLVLPAHSLANFFAMLFSLGVPILYSEKAGAFKKEEADRVFGVGILASILTGAALFFVLLAGGNAFLKSYGPEPQVLSNAEAYLSWIKYAVLLMPVCSVMAGMVYADGDEAVSNLSNLITGVGNVVLSILFCRWWGIRGVAFASFLSLGASLFILLFHFRRKGNSLRLNLAFSFPVLKDIAVYSAVDASTYLFIALFTAGMNLYVAKAFGAEALVLVVAVTMLKECEFVFDGIGEAITPLIGVYLGEETYPGVREVWRLAGRTAMIESLLGMILFELGAPALIRILGIGESPFAGLSVWGLRIMALTLVFSCRMFLDTSYFILIDKIRLGVFVSAMRDVLFSLPLAVLGGTVGGIRGMFAGLAIAPAVAYAVSYFYIRARYGKENYALFLAGKEKERTWFYEFRAVPEEIVDARDRIGNALTENGCPESLANRTMLLFEEFFMLVHDKNPGNEVLAECFVELGEKVRLIAKDNGEILDLTDPDMEIGSLRVYLISLLMNSHTTRRGHFLILSYNRNVFEIN